MKIEPFGDVNPKELEECYEGEIQFSGKSIPVELWFEEEETDGKTLENVQKIMDKGIDGGDAGI